MKFEESLKMEPNASRHSSSAMYLSLSSLLLPSLSFSPSSPFPLSLLDPPFPPSNPGAFPDMADTLHFFQTSFNHAKARKDGVIVPHEGNTWSHDLIHQRVDAESHTTNFYHANVQILASCDQITFEWLQPLASVIVDAMNDYHDWI